MGGQGVIIMSQLAIREIAVRTPSRQLGGMVRALGSA